MSNILESRNDERPIVNIYAADTIYFWSIKHQTVVKLTRELFQNNRNGFSCELCIPRYAPFTKSKPCPFVGHDFDRYRRHVINSENYYRRALVWTSLNDIPTHELQRSREIGHLKSLEKAPFLRVEFIGRTIVKRRADILDYFRENGCHCKEHLGVQCRVKCDQWMSLFSHLKHIERENYRLCVFEATAAELQNALRESNTVNRMPIFIHQVACHDGGDLYNGDPQDLLAANFHQMPDPEVTMPDSSADNSNDSNDCALTMVECVLDDQSEVARPAANDCRVVSIYEPWQVPAEQYSASDASKCLQVSLPLDSLPLESLPNVSRQLVAVSSDISRRSVARASSDTSEIRSRMISHLNRLSAQYDARKPTGSCGAPSISSEDDDELYFSEDDEENDADIGLDDLIAGLPDGDPGSQAIRRDDSNVALEEAPNVSPAMANSPIDDLPNLEDDILEVIYASRPIKREVLDETVPINECDRNDLAKRFKIDYEGCIVID